MYLSEYDKCYNAFAFGNLGIDTLQLLCNIFSIAFIYFTGASAFSYNDHVTNEEVRRKIQAAIGEYDELLTLVKKRKLRWFGHVSRSPDLAPTGHSERKKKKKQMEEEVRKQYQRVDRNRLCQLN